jgi:hypothetical protein
MDIGDFVIHICDGNAGDVPLKGRRGILLDYSCLYDDLCLIEFAVPPSMNFHNGELDYPGEPFHPRSYRTDGVANKWYVEKKNLVLDEVLTAKKILESYGD